MPGGFYRLDGPTVLRQLELGSRRGLHQLEAGELEEDEQVSQHARRLLRCHLAILPQAGA